jgi:hypothetical protein
MKVCDLQHNEPVTVQTFDGMDCYDFEAGMLKAGGFGYLTAVEGAYGYNVTVGNRLFSQIMEACA